MSQLEFYQTRAGRSYYEHTLPELIRQLERLNENLEKLLQRRAGRKEKADSSQGKQP